MRRKEKIDEKEERFDPLAETLHCLHSILEGSEVREDVVYLPEEELAIRPGISMIKDRMASLYFYVFHPDLEEPFYDMASGIGETIADAIHQSCASFLFSGFCGIRHCVTKEYDKELVTEFMGKKKIWQVSSSCIASIGGQSHPPEGGYWALIQEKLPEHLGNKKYYWIKIYASKLNKGDVTCECRINDIVSKELSDCITEYANGWEVQGAIESEKQFYFLTQREETHIPYPYTQKQIWGFTEQALHIWEECDTEEKYQKIEEDFFAITQDRNLAVELRSFIPEICAMHAFPEVQYQEKLTFFYEDRQYEVRIDQICSYRWMEQKIGRMLQERTLKTETFKQIVYESAICNVLSKALNEGNKLEDMVMSSLAIMVPDDYIIR